MFTYAWITVLFQKNSKDFFITIRSRYPLSYTSIWGKKIDMYFNFFLIKNEKKSSYFGWKYSHIFIKAKSNGIMHKSHVKMWKAKCFYSSLSTNMHNHIRKITFDLLNETWKFDCLMLTMHTHRMLQGNFTRLWWIRHPLWRLMTQGTNEPLLLNYYYFMALLEWQ